MKVLEFAFDSREDSDYLPHNYEKNCVVYTGTHDNQTLKSWFDELTDWDREFAVEYMHLENVKKEDIPMEIVRVALASVANLAVIPMQDYLGRDQAARINTPSTLGDNWKWRLTGEELSDGLAAEINRLTRLYSR